MTLFVTDLHFKSKIKDINGSAHHDPDTSSPANAICFSYTADVEVEAGRQRVNFLVCCRCNVN
jgi:hypothetical protein